MLFERRCARAHPLLKHVQRCIWQGNSHRGLNAQCGGQFRGGHQQRACPCQRATRVHALTNLIAQFCSVRQPIAAVVVPLPGKDAMAYLPNLERGSCCVWQPPCRSPQHAHRAQQHQGTTGSFPKRELPRLHSRRRPRAWVSCTSSRPWSDTAPRLGTLFPVHNGQTTDPPELRRPGIQASKAQQSREPLARANTLCSPHNPSKPFSRVMSVCC